jgi:hypothetical protein
VILKRSWAGEVKNISVLIAIGVGTDGFRQILGVAEGEKEDLEGWRGFPVSPKRPRPYPDGHYLFLVRRRFTPIANFPSQSKSCIPAEFKVR